jgi:transposase
MDVCILNQDGEIMVHRDRKASPAPCLKAIAPYREDMVVAVECLLTWYGLADLCAPEGLPFVLGHALSRKASHGGKAKHDTIDAQKSAVLLRGGMWPQADVYPAAMRATRDLLRRRMPLLRQRAEVLTHVPQTNHQYHLPAFSKNIADKANRDGLAERFAAPAVQQNIEGDLALIGCYDQRRNDVELSIGRTAKHHDPATFSQLQSVPGVGKILRLVLLDEIHEIRRVPRVQDFVSYCRLVTCATESAGTRYGASGTKIGNAYLKGAFSEAAGLFRRDNPAGQKSLTRRDKTPGTGTALTIGAHKLARAVDYRLRHHTAFERHQFLGPS